jgi:methyltransferase (TIGR00027 family)
VALEQWVPAEQRIVHDPLAYRLLPAYLKGLVALCRVGPLRRALLGGADRSVPGIVGGLLCRKRYIDECLVEALAADISSVVILGAGFDTRAYRLPELRSRQVYEVDLPQNTRAKEAALRRLVGRVPDHVRLVPVDFDRQDLGARLRGAGYSGLAPCFFIVEGVTQYISEAAVHKMFEFLQKAPVGSRLAFSYVRQDFIDGERLYGLEILHKRTRVQRSLWRFGLEPEAIGSFLDRYDWQELEQVGRIEYEERYLRPVGRTMPVMEVERMVHAERGV